MPSVTAAAMTEAREEEPQGVKEVLGELDELAAENPRVCIGDVLDDFGPRSFGPGIMIPALLDISPAGGIPGLTTMLAAIIALTAIQLVLGRDRVWMPQFIRTRAITGKKLHKAVGGLRAIGAWLDNHSHGRLQGLTQGLVLRIAATAIIALCCIVPPLELIPWASTVPMFAIAVFGLALTTRDGVVMLVALALVGAAAAAGALLLATVAG